MYTPPESILEKYAQVLVNFALGEGKGIEKGDVVMIKLNEFAVEFLPALTKIILQSGGQPLVDIEFSNLRNVYYAHATDEQLQFSPTAMIQSAVNTADHVLILKSPVPLSDDVDSKKYDLFKNRIGESVRYRKEKYRKGKLTYTLAYYPNQHLAELAECTLEAYWLELIKACYLDHSDPISRWKKTFEEMHRTRDALNKLDIESLHIKSQQVDLTIGIGEKRRWIAGSGRNIPSFEIFTSPDWRTVNGTYTVTEPVMINGKIVKLATLVFKDGEVVQAKAHVNDAALQELLQETNAKRVGEFSLTDKRHSAITRYLAATLFDENRGGEYGNTHIALGNSYVQAYKGDRKKETPTLGFNDSPVHVDVVNTENRIVTAKLRDGSEKVIYENGMFTV